MKRTIIAAALIAGTFMSAQADYVASDNIYGIINVPIVAGMNAVGVSLLPMDPAADRLHDVILPDGLTAGTQEAADGLWLYGTTYDKYYLATGNVWTNGGVGPAAALGMGAWIKAAAPATIYQVGIVSNVASIAVAAADTGATFMANPYPADLDVDGVDSMIDWSGVAAMDKNALTGDRLMIWTGTKYDTFYWFNNGSISGWYSADNKGRRPPLIPAGEGFFFQRKTSDADPVVVANPL
jgi:hypothetical protein